MKFTCEKSQLANAISVASRTVCQKSSIAALEGILLRAEDRLYLTGYNLETGITVQLDAQIIRGGDCVMPARNAVTPVPKTRRNGRMSRLPPSGMK